MEGGGEGPGVFFRLSNLLGVPFLALFLWISFILKEQGSDPSDLMKSPPGGPCLGPYSVGREGGGGGGEGHT